MRLSRHTELDRDLTLKFARAECHLDKLRHSIDEWREKRLYRFQLHRESEGRDAQGRQIWLSTWDAIQLEPFPEEWVVRAGELLYQCHSALDHLAWELANTKAITEEPDRITFPIYTSRSAFWKRGRHDTFRQGSGGWRLKRILGPARIPILEVQPYKRGNRAPEHPLAHLFVLSNQDKHQALHVAASALKKQSFKGLTLEDLEFLGSGVNAHAPFDERGRRIFWHRVREAGPKPKLYGQVDLVIEPVFGQGSPDALVGEPFFDTLRAIYNYCVVEVMQRRFNPLLS